MRPARVLSRLRVLWIILLALVATARPALAAEQALFGPAQFTRTAGPPDQFSQEIALPPTLVAPFRLHVENGSPDGTHRVSSATITLNGAQVAGLSDFNQQVAAFDRSVALQPNNTLQVRLASEPGSFLTLTLYGTIPPPTLTSLLPPTLPIAEGGTGLLTATISAVQLSPTTLGLISDNPAAATVPPTATIGSGELTTDVPVTGVAPGTATITATLNESSVSSVVTVAPSKPRLTSLFPPALPVGQGASGSLTVTINAVQATDTVVYLASSAPGIVALPPSGAVIVPAGQLDQSFAVFGLSPGSATITAELNGTTTQSQVSVVVPVPTVVSLLPLVLPLTEGGRGALIVALNAAQPTDSTVALSTSDPAVVGVPSTITVPAQMLTAAVSVQGLALGLATVTASLNGMTATTAIEVLPPPPTLAALACPAMLTPAATSLCTLALDAAPLTDTVVPLASSAPRVASVPPTVTIAAETLEADFAVTGLAAGMATITAGPVNGVTEMADVTIIPPPPTILSLTPSAASLSLGATANLTLTLNAAQPTDTTVGIASSAPDVAGVPPTVTVPAGSPFTTVTVVGLANGTATLTAGPLNGTQAISDITVAPLAPAVIALGPETLSLPKGTAGALSLTIAPTQSEPTVLPLGSSAASTVGVPPMVTVPAGATSAAFPVLAEGEGGATVTAGPLNGTSRSAIVTVTPPELLALVITPASPSIAKGQTQPFTVTGTFTDAGRRDLTASAVWNSSNSAVAAITSPGGVASGQGVGQVTITAMVGNVSATATLTVTPPVLASLTLSPPNPTVDEGQALQFQALGALTDGTTQDLTAAVTWSSSTPTVATITSPGGLASALTPGAAAITATHAASGLSASTTLTVHLPPPTITGFSPTGGQVGDPITITGRHFFGVQMVTFNGTVASGFTAQGATSLTVAVPTGATTGPLSVTTPAGTATSADPFVVRGPVDFLLAAAPTTAMALAGDQVSYRITAEAFGEFAGSIALSVAGAPAGVTVLLSPPQIAPGGVGATLTVAVASSVTPGSVTLTLTGSALINGVLQTHSIGLAVEILAPGRTALSGRVVDTDEQPLQGVAVILGGQTASTDANGNFLLLDPPVGEQVVLIDGGPASTPTQHYPTIPVSVSIAAGQANHLPYLPHLHAQKNADFTQIDPAQETVVTDPDLPGVALRIPAGAQIIGWDGQPNTQVSIRTVPIDRLPVSPLPPEVNARTVYMFYFGKQGGGIPATPIPFEAPNDLGLALGEKAELWYFDESPTLGESPNAWRLAGAGTVSADGTLIATDPGVGIPKFCCGAAAWSSSRVGGAQGGPTPQKGFGTPGADPVDLSTGIFILTKTDLVLPGRIPVSLTRTYRSGDTAPGPFGVGTTLTFDDVLLQTASTVLTYAYEGNARTQFFKQPDGSYVNTTVPAFRGARITVNPDGTKSLRYRDGQILRFDTFGLLIEVRDRTGNAVSIERQVEVNPTALREPGGRAISISWVILARDRVTTATDPLGRTVRYDYDGSNRLVAVTDPAGGVTTYTYDSSSRLLTITDPRGLTFLTNTYDANGRVCRQQLADGGFFTMYYVTADQATLLASVQLLAEAQAGGPLTQPPCNATPSSSQVVATVLVDPQNHPTTYRFNGTGLRTAVTDALGQTTTFAYDASNLVTATTDPLSRVTRFTYDAQSNVAAITDPAGNLRTFTYEPTFNKLTRLTDPLGHVTTFAYDAKGNVSSITDPLGSTTTITSNAFGQPVTTTDPLGNTTRFDYDAVGNLVTITDPLGNSSTRTYDPVSRLLTQTDPRGNQTTFTYDDLNRLTQLVDALNGVTRFTYDGTGNLLTVTDALNHTITHTYDSMDRLATRIDPLGRTETFSYDGNGNLTSTTDRKGQSAQFEYDVLNRRVRSTFADGSTSTVTYDAAGRLAQADDSADPHRPITLGYDTLDRLMNETTALGTVSYGYDVLGRRIQMQVNDLSPVSYTYDAASHLRTITQTPLNPVDIQYDALGRRTRLTLPNGVSTEYQYDVASRLTALIYRNATGVLGDLTYTYDATGNRTSVGGSFARTLLPDAVPSATYDAANQQLTFGDKTMTYDANGNLTTITDPSGVTAFTWDGRNRLASLSGPGTTASFGYDALGRRAAKTVNGQLIEYLYDGADIVGQSDSLGTTSYLRSLNIDETFSFTNRDGTYFSIYDPLGSTLAVTDQGGNPIVQYTYDPFGNSVSTNPTFPNPFEYAGRENDRLAGLYHYRTRVYSPALHRFLSEDPIDLAGRNPNFYTYVFNSPVNFTDSTGLIADLLVDASFILYDLYRLAADGRKGLGGNLTALGLDAGALFLPFVTGLGPVSRGAKVAGEGTEIVQRAMSRAELEATQATGLLRGGREGTHFVSDAVNSDALRARQRLALPRTPDVRVTLEAPAGVFSTPTRVAPGFNMPGGGMERLATGNIPVRIIRVDPF